MRSDLNPIRPPDLHHFRAAQGWLELGSPREATVELDHIAPEMRSHPDVLEVQWHICARENRWIACVEIGSTLVMKAPDRSDSWIHYSFALHCLNRSQEALDILLLAAQQFSDVWQVPYNLACFCSALGRFDDARDWFNKALSIDEKSARRAYLADPDLQLWDTLGSPIWKTQQVSSDRPEAPQV